MLDTSCFSFIPRPSPLKRGFPSPSGLNPWARQTFFPPFDVSYSIPYSSKMCQLRISDLFRPQFFIRFFREPVLFFPRRRPIGLFFRAEGLFPHFYVGCHEVFHSFSPIFLQIATFWTVRNLLLDNVLRPFIFFVIMLCGSLYNFQQER